MCDAQASPRQKSLIAQLKPFGRAFSENKTSVPQYVNDRPDQEVICNRFQKQIRHAHTRYRLSAQQVASGLPSFKLLGAVVLPQRVVVVDVARSYMPTYLGSYGLPSIMTQQCPHNSTPAHVSKSYMRVDVSAPERLVCKHRHRAAPDRPDDRVPDHGHDSALRRSVFSPVFMPSMFLQPRFCALQEPCGFRKIVFSENSDFLLFSGYTGLSYVSATA